MGDKTSKFESAQALFCAIADYVGSDNIDKVLNLTKYPNYTKFKSGKWNNITNQTRIDKAAEKLDTTSDLNEIESFLTNEKSWYTSSVKIATTLIEELGNLDKDFKSIAKPKFLADSIYYLRGDKAVMDNIQKLFELANNNTKWSLMKSQTRFGDVNKWSPADIYYAKNSTRQVIINYLATAQGMKSFDFTDLNDKIRLLIDKGDLLPLSLKKSTVSPALYPVNFDTNARDTTIDGKSTSEGKVDGGLWYMPNASLTNGNLWTEYKPLQRQHYSPYEPYGTSQPEALKNKNSRKGSRDIVLFVANNQGRSNKIGNIQMRHDASGSGSWKVDFKYSGGESRGGSVVSWRTFGDILGAIDSTVGENFKLAFQNGQSSFKSKLNGRGFKVIVGPKSISTDYQDLTGQNLKSNRKQLDADFIKAAKLNPNATVFGIKYDKDTKEEGVESQNPYTNLRGELSGRAVLNEVGPVLNTWLTDKKNTEVPKGMTHSNVDKFIRVLFRYVTSQSKKSGQFVIAK